MKRAAAWGQGSMGRRDARGAGGNLEGERGAHHPDGRDGRVGAHPGFSRGD